MRALSFLVALGSALPALAQVPDLVEEDKVKQALEDAGKVAEAAPQQGWQYKLDLGFNGGFSHSDTVIGQADGSTLQLGLALNGSADLYAGQHEWRNTLSYGLQQTKTPSIDTFVKTGDNLDVATMWLYKPAGMPWLGPFARARMQAPIFAGHLVFGEDKNLAIQDAAGTSVSGGLAGATDADGNAIAGQNLLPAQEQFQLTKAFEPLTLRESIGAFARALDRSDVKVTFTAGLGAMEIFSRDGFAVADNADTKDVIEVKQLQDSIQLGVEVGGEASGTIGQQLTWSLLVNSLYPFVVDAETDLEGVELTNVEVGGKVGLKLTKWVSVDYVLTAKRIPLILDEWQIQNGVLVSTAFNLL